MRILITGTSGFIGSKLVKYLSNNPGNVLYCITRSPSKPFENDIVNWISQDLSKEFDYSCLPEQIDVIIHLAQSRGYKNFPESALDIFRVNDYSTAQLLDYGRRVGIKSFILASTGGVYRSKKSSFLEEDPIDSSGFYPASKSIAECLVNSYSGFFSTIILRYFFVYGVGQKNMFIPNLIDSIKNGKPIIIYNKRGIRVTPIYIDDAIKATSNATALHGNEVINVAGSEAMSILELSEIIGDILGKDPLYEYRIDPNVKDFVANTDKMKLVLGVEPEIPIKEGIRRMIENVEKCRARATKYYEDSYKPTSSLV